MRKFLLNTIFAIIGLFSFSSNYHIQNNELDMLQEKKYSKTQIESFVREVFKDKADELVLNSKSRRLEIITNFLNRFEVAERPELADKKIQKLSEVQLSNKYNSNLKLDTYYNSSNFNPLKYNFNMSSNEVLLYRIGNSNYIIRILPLN